MGPEGTWSIIDEKRSEFHLRPDGRCCSPSATPAISWAILLIEAIAYQGDKMLVLDKTRDSFTVYNRTEYGDILIKALTNSSNRRDWHRD